MANRSDFQSNFPRQYKRQLAMQEAYGYIKDSHERGEMKRAMISAHKHYRDYVNKRGTMAVGQNISLEEGTE